MRERRSLNDITILLFRKIKYMLGHLTSCSDLLSAMENIENLYYSSLNPFHPFYGEMPGDDMARQEWIDRRFTKEPEDRMRSWVTGASENDLSLVSQCFQAHQMLISKDYCMTMSLILDTIARERFDEYDDLFLPQVDQSHGNLNDYQRAVVDSAEEYGHTKAIALFERLYPLLDADSQEYLSRAMKSLGPTLLD